MILPIRKLAPGSLSRAIVALVARTGNKTVQPAGIVDQSEEFHYQTANHCGHVKLKRTTISVERERLVTLRIERHRSS
jgi:hypothetical protein